MKTYIDRAEIIERLNRVESRVDEYVKNYGVTADDIENMVFQDWSFDADVEPDSCNYQLMRDRQNEIITFYSSNEEQSQT